MAISSSLSSSHPFAASIFSCNCACLSMSFSISSGLASPMLLLTASYSCSKATSSFLPSSRLLDGLVRIELWFLLEQADAISPLSV